MGDNDPERQIPNSIGSDEKLVGPYTLAEVAVVLLPGVLVIVGIQLLGPYGFVFGLELRRLAIPLVVAAMGVGLVIVHLTPHHMDSLEWIASVLTFVRRRRRRIPGRDPRAIGVRRIHRQRDAVERTDGGLVGIVQVDHSSMALADGDDWRRATSSFADFLITTVEFPIQLYSTTRNVDADVHLAPYEDRLADPDLRDNQRLQSLIEGYCRWYRRSVTDRQTIVRYHYVVISVVPGEIDLRQRRVSGSWSLPGIDHLRKLVGATRAADRKSRQFRTLDRRCQKVSDGVDKVHGCVGTRLDAVEVTRLLRGFWTGRRGEDSDLDQVLHTPPLVGGDHG